MLASNNALVLVFLSRNVLSIVLVDLYLHVVIKLEGFYHSNQIYYKCDLVNDQISYSHVIDDIFPFR